MAHIALRPFLANGKQYKAGDTVQVDQLPAKAVTHLVTRRMMRVVESSEGAGKSSKGGR